MKHSSSPRVEKSTITNGVNVTSIEGSTINGNVHAGPTTINQFHRGRRSSRPAEYPASSIGSDLVQRNYVRYLVERYHRFRQADSGFGRGPARFSYAVIFKISSASSRLPRTLSPKRDSTSLWNICSDALTERFSASAIAPEGSATMRVPRNLQLSRGHRERHGFRTPDMKD